jgi:hypothetical protein
MSDSTHSPSLREALAASFDTHAGSDTGTSTPDTSAPLPDGSSGKESTPSPSPTEGATAAPSGDRPRDASGRFAPSSGQPAAKAPGPDDMPDGYDANVWQMLSPEARAQTAAWAGKQRETVAEREARLKQYEPIDRVLSQQRRDALSMQYGGVDRALEQLFALSDFAARDPNGFVQHFAQQRGVNLAGLMQQPQQGAQQQQVSPQQAIAAMVQQEIERRDVDRLYNEFAGQADLEHRNDPQVRTTMAALLAANQAKDYRSAYDMAVRAHPDLGPKWAQAQAAASTKDQQAVAAETARARASAAASLSGAPGTTRPAGNAAPASIREGLERAWNSAGGARV